MNKVNRLTKLVHLRLEALLVTASLTLIPSLLVDNTRSVAFASVNRISSHASHEEAAATVASVDSVMTAGRYIATNPAQDVALAIFTRGIVRRYARFNDNFPVLYKRRIQREELLVELF